MSLTLGAGLAALTGNTDTAAGMIELAGKYGEKLAATSISAAYQTLGAAAQEYTAGVPNPVSGAFHGFADGIDKVVDEDAKTSIDHVSWEEFLKESTIGAAKGAASSGGIIPYTGKLTENAMREDLFDETLSADQQEFDHMEELTSAEFLPVNYKHHICSVKEGVDGVNITLRLAVSTEEGAKKWLESMQKSSLATFRVERTHPSSGEKVLYKTEFRCQHNTKPRTATANQRRGSKNTSCPAGLSIIVKVSTFERSDGRVRKSRSSDPHLPDHPMVVKFKSTHNHLLRSADALKHRDVSEDVKEKFLDLFSKGYTPSKALALHKYDLQLQHNDNYVFVSADRAITPDLHYTYRLYYQTFKKEYGEAKGEFVLKELERRIKDGSLGDGVKLSKSSAEENGSDPKLNELHKAFLALQQSYIGDKEFLGGPVQKFTKKLLELNSGTNTALASALHCFGRYSGVAGALGKKRKSLVSMKKIGVQPMALARRKMVAGGRHRIGAGRPSKDCFTRRKETVPFSSQHMPTCRRKAQHNIREC
ncbi:uncharacterized protein LOC135158094, partial [Lytechinus pictus]|uniref:uncharacterized protein LOC135158094 n=1 Tax=Lytechinus pictus TaxID=7653 RepID=UPI0030B9B826